MAKLIIALRWEFKLFSNFQLAQSFVCLLNFSLHLECELWCLPRPVSFASIWLCILCCGYGVVVWIDFLEGFWSTVFLVKQSRVAHALAAASSHSIGSIGQKKIKKNKICLFWTCAWLSLSLVGDSLFVALTLSIALFGGALGQSSDRLYFCGHRWTARLIRLRWPDAFTTLRIRPVLPAVCMCVSVPESRPCVCPCERASVSSRVLLIFDFRSDPI